MSDLDPFALGGRQEGDELVLSLFRQWIAICGEVDALAPQAEETDDGRNVHQRWNEIEDEIMASPPGGAVALAIKAYICIRQSHDGGSWSSHTATLRLNEDHRDMLITRPAYCGTRLLWFPRSASWLPRLSTKTPS